MANNSLQTMVFVLSLVALDALAEGMTTDFVLALIIIYLLLSWCVAP